MVYGDKTAGPGEGSTRAFWRRERERSGARGQAPRAVRAHRVAGPRPPAGELTRKSASDNEVASVCAKGRPFERPDVYANHRLEKRYPAEYRRLRDGCLAEDRRLGEKLLDEERRLWVTGCQLGCYALYGSESDLEQDTLDLDNRRMSVPHYANFMAGELKGLLFLGMSGIFQTVVDRLFLEEGYTSGEGRGISVHSLPDSHDVPVQRRLTEVFDTKPRDAGKMGT